MPETFHEAGFYLDEAGRPVPMTAVRRLVYEAAADHAEELAGLAAAYAAGGGTHEAFAAMALGEVEAAGLAAAAAALGGANSPGREAAEALVDSHLAHFRKFLAAVADGTVPRDESLAGRLALYGGLPRVAFESCLREARLSAGALWERRVEPDGGCCAECAALAARGWQPAGALPEVGDSACSAACRCHFAFALEEDGPDQAESSGDFDDEAAEFGFVNRLAQRWGLSGNREDIGPVTPGKWYEVEPRDKDGKWTPGGAGAQGEADEKKVRPIVRDDGSVGATNGKILVHVDDKGYIDHGPAGYRGRHEDDLPARQWSSLRETNLQGFPADVAHGYAGRENFHRKAYDEIESVRQHQVRSGVSGGERAQTEMHLRNALAKMTDEARGHLGGARGGTDESADYWMRKAHEDPRDEMVIRSAQGAPHLFGAARNAGSSTVRTSIKGVEGPSVHALESGALGWSWGTGGKALDSARDALKTALSQAHTLRDKDVEGLKANLIKNLTDTEAEHLARHAGLRVTSDDVARHTGKDNPVAHALADVAGRTVSELGGVARREQYERAKQVYGDAVAQSLQGLRKVGKDVPVLAPNYLEHSKDQFNAFRNHLDVMGRANKEGTLTDKHVADTAAALKKHWSVKQLAHLGRVLGGDEAFKGLKTKDAIIGKVLEPYRSRFSAPDDGLDELVVRFGGGEHTVAFVADALAAMGLGEAASLAVFDRLEPAECDDNEELLPLAFAAGQSMRVQTLLFPKENYTPDQARAWCEKHGYAHDKVETTANFHRLRQFDPEACQGEPRTIEFKKAQGVKAVVCLRPAKHSQDDPPSPDHVLFEGAARLYDDVVAELLGRGLDDGAVLDAVSALGPAPASMCGGPGSGVPGPCPQGKAREGTGNPVGRPPGPGQGQQQPPQQQAKPEEQKPERKPGRLRRAARRLAGKLGGAAATVAAKANVAKNAAAKVAQKLAASKAGQALAAGVKKLHEDATKSTERHQRVQERMKQFLANRIARLEGKVRDGTATWKERTQLMYARIRDKIKDKIGLGEKKEGEPKVKGWLATKLLAAGKAVEGSLAGRGVKAAGRAIANSPLGAAARVASQTAPVRTAAWVVRKLWGYSMDYSKMNKEAAKKITKKLKRRWPGMGGRMLNRLANLVNYTATAHKVALYVAAAPLTGGASLGWAAYYLSGVSNRKAFWGPIVLGAANAVAGAPRALKKAAKAAPWDKLPPFHFAEDDFDSPEDAAAFLDGGDIDPSEVPDDFDWDEAVKIAEPDAEQALQDYLHHVATGEAGKLWEEYRDVIADVNTDDIKFPQPPSIHFSGGPAEEADYGPPTAECLERARFLASRPHPGEVLAAASAFVDDAVARLEKRAGAAAGPALEAAVLDPEGGGPVQAALARRLLDGPAPRGPGAPADDPESLGLEFADALYDIWEGGDPLDAGLGADTDLLDGLFEGD